MAVQVAGSFHAEFRGYKQPWSFEKDGKKIDVPGKLQFLATDAENGEVEVWAVSQAGWQAAGGAPYVDLEPGAWFLIEGTIDITAPKPWFRITSVAAVES